MGRTVRKRSRTLREREKEMSEARNFLRFITFFGIVIGVLVVVGLVLSSSCKAQTTPENYRKSIIIYAFKGLNTSAGVFGTEPDYATTSINIDYSRFGNNTIGKRLGFDSVKTVAGIDSIVGFDTYQRSDRQSCLVYAVDDSTKGYGAIYATRFGSDNPDSARKIKDYWSIQNPTRFSQYNDNLYATNGQQNGLVWDGTRARPFPLPVSGIPQIVPLNTSGNLNGEYRYCIFQAKITRAGADYIDWAGPLSPAINVKSGRVLLRAFPRAIGDSAINYGNYLQDSLIDSVRIYFGRTKANPGAIDDEDTIWQIGSLLIKRDTSTQKFPGDTNSYTDNTPDDSLTVANGFNRLTIAESRGRAGRDSTGTKSRRWGAPTFIGRDTVTGGNWQIWADGDNQAGTQSGYAYTVTLQDTILGLESDTSRSLFIIEKYKDSGYKSPHRLTIGLPKLPAALDSGYALNVYRSRLLLFWRPYTLICVAERVAGSEIVCDKYDTIWQWLPPGTNSTIKSGPKVKVDSAVAIDYYRVGQVSPTAGIFIDSIRTDTAHLHNRRFNISAQPEIFSQMFQWRGRLGGVAGSRIWWSAQFVDSQGNFGTNDFDDFNRNDGDFATAVGEAQWGLKVKKNRSAYVKPNGGGRPEKVSSFGCVAPLSYISTDVGDLFVGDGGVYLETEGQALERVYNAGLVSEKLSNFVNMPDSVRRTISGFWLPEKRQAIFSADYPNTSNDTAFVLDFRAGQIWTTWTNMVPKFGCLYSKNSTLGSPPPQTFYFTKAGGKILYKYGTSDYDVSSSVMAPIIYETPRLFPSSNLEQIDAIGLVVRGMIITADSVSLIVYDQHGTNASSTIVYDSLSYIEGTSQTAAGPRYSYKDVDSRPSMSPYVKLFTGSSNRQLLRGSIEAIEILYREGVEKVMVK